MSRLAHQIWLVVVSTTITNLSSIIAKLQRNSHYRLMAVHRIRELGDPILRVRCEPITSVLSPAVRLVADDLRDTLLDWRARYGTGRGIAAPQIGAPVRIVQLELDRSWTLINPEIVARGPEDFTVWDDCFSFPDLWVRVLRAFRVTIRFHDLRGAPAEATFDGDHAELVQHEIDHLDGILAVDRAYGPDPFCLAAQWRRRYRPSDRYGAPRLRGDEPALP